MHAETGVRDFNAYGTPYKGYDYTNENQQLVDDLEGIHIRKLIWAHLYPDSPNMVYWWKENILNKGLWKYFKSFQNFMEDIPLANGNYKDARAVSSNAILRAWGQKDVINNKCHLWIDNAPYTWKAVVDYNWIPLAYDPKAKYANGSICADTAIQNIYRNITGYNTGDPSGIDWELVCPWDRNEWRTTGNAYDPKPHTLPPPVSGTVTISGFAPGPYIAEWWNTSDGTITGADTVEADLNGDITINAVSLESDAALKIYPQNN